MGKYIHGHTINNSFSQEYRAYCAMKTRVMNPNQARFKDYGGRGIVICDRWLTGEAGLTGFECFLADMGSKPSPQHTLDREDNDGPYSPANCRWATRVEQARNTRSNRIIAIAGIEIGLAEAIERWAAVSNGAVRQRLHRGWDAEDAIFTPPMAAKGDYGFPLSF